MSRTARETFFNSAHKAELQKIVDSPTFEIAKHYALLTLMEEAPTIFGSPEQSWQHGVHEAGARRVLEILSTLHLPQTELQRPRERTLNYNEK